MVRRVRALCFIGAERKFVNSSCCVGYPMERPLMGGVSILSHMSVIVAPACMCDTAASEAAFAEQTRPHFCVAVSSRARNKNEHVRLIC